jgi:hypothetical protein
LNARRVRYLVVGAYAVGFHARPRATKDIDVLVDPTRANAPRVRAALEDFLGTKTPSLTIAKLTNKRTLVVVGVPPVRIDLLTNIDGVRSFAAAYKRRAKGRFGAAPASYLSLEDLIASKEAAARPQDLADLVALRRAAARSRRR